MREVQNQLALNRRDQEHLVDRRQQADQRLAQELDRQRSLKELQKQGKIERNDLTKQLAQLDRSLRDQAEQLASLEQWLTAGRSRRQQHSARLDELKGEMVDVLSSKAQATTAWSRRAGACRNWSTAPPAASRRVLNLPQAECRRPGNWRSRGSGGGNAGPADLASRNPNAAA